MADLLVTPFPIALANGQARRTYAIARALAALGPVDFVHPGETPAAYERIDGLTAHPLAPSRGARRALTYVRARSRGVPAGLARAISPELIDALETLADAPGRDRVIVDTLTGAAVAARVARRRPFVYAAHNLESAFRPQIERNFSVVAENRWNAPEHAVSVLAETSRWETFERGLLSAAAETWMPSRLDIDGARRLAPGARVRYVPNAVDVAAIPAAGPDRRSRRALFVADLRWPPNRDALSFLTGEIMPHVWSVLADARLTVVGRGLDPRAALDRRVEYLGFVDDLTAVYTTAACALVPLRLGGGSPLKFVEALAHALPVVATPKAAAGLDAHAGRHYLEGDTPEAFAAAVVRVLSHGADATARNGRALAEESYSIEAVSGLIAPEARDVALAVPQGGS